MQITGSPAISGEVLLHRAIEAHMAGRLSEAVDLYRNLLGVSPASIEAWNNLAFALTDLGRQEEAITAFRAALVLKPDYAKPLIGFGALCYARNRLGNAIVHWRRAFHLDPRQAGVAFNLGIALQAHGAADEAAACFRAVVERQPDAPRLHSQLLLCLNYLDLPGESLLDEHRRFDARFTRQDAASPSHSNAPDPDRKLRIGYLSVEFRAHLGGYFLTPLLEGHDRSAFEIYCYSILPDAAADHLTQHFKAHADAWRTVGHLSDEALVAMIREDRIDILVDLAGHSGLNRLPALAHKPAPVQMTWLGYPNTSGLSAIDYRLVDRISDPEGAADGHASERLLRLPAPFLCFRPPADAPDVVPLPAEATGCVTFGSFNKLAKMSAGTVQLWAEILRRVPDARLLLKDKALNCPDTAEAIRARFRRAGADPSRLDLLGWVDATTGHLGAYNRMDVALDPFPYNGTITTCDALWMGAPVVTLLGKRHAARVGASLLAAVGLPELIAATPERYVETAVSLARDSARLRWLRTTMRDRLRGSVLCDEARFMRGLETLYRESWLCWCASRTVPRVAAR